MPRQPKKEGNRSPNETVPTQFRLKRDALDDLDAIAAHLAETTGMPVSRADALRSLIKQAKKKIPKKSSSSA